MKRAATVGFSVLAVVMAIGLLGPIAGLGVAWLLLSPDAVASTARGGGAGATAAAVTAATDHLRHEWRAGAPARQRRRTARRDRWWQAGGWRRDALKLEHGVVIAWRALRSAWVAAARAFAVVPAGFSAGAQAARDHRAGRTQPDPSPGPDEADGADEAVGEPELGPLQPASPAQPASGPAAPAAGAAGAPAGPPDSGGRPAAGQAPHPPPTGDDMPQTTQTTDAVPGTGELTTTDDLRAESEQIASTIGEAEVLAGLISQWQTGLPEAYAAGQAAGGPSTRALDEAVNAVAEAGGDAVALAEALNLVRRACDQADALGEQATAMGAEGHTHGYVTA